MPVAVDMLSVYVALGVAAALSVSAVIFGALTAPAAVTAGVMLTAAAVFWSFTGLTIYVLLFAISVIVGAIGRKKRKERTERLHKRAGARTVVQVLANGLPALLMMAVWFFTGYGAFKVAAAAALAEGFSDSAAGDVGVLSNGKTVSVLNFKPVKRGLSGGISVAGCVAMTIASAVAAAVPAIFGEYAAAGFGIAAGAGILGCMADSVMGATLQALYRCPECGAETERRECCGKKTELIRGFSRLDNDAVNGIAGCIAALAGLAAAAFIIKY